LRYTHCLPWIAIIIFLAGCIPGRIAEPEGLEITPALPPAATSTIFPISDIKLFLAPELPTKLAEMIQIPAGVEIIGDKASANVKFIHCDQETPTTSWYYVKVEPFTKLVSNPEIIVMSEDTFRTTAFESSEFRIEIIEKNLIYDSVIKQKGSIALIPFEEITTQWRALSTIPGDAVDFCLVGDEDAIDRLVADSGFVVPVSNFSPEKMTVLAMTGVTALVRQTGEKMEEQGILYPAEKIGELLREADITHISNEVSFSENCQVTSNGTKFCSKPEYFELLKEVGADIIELTGNHEMDHGSDAFLYSLSLYETSGMQYFGGGRNVAEAEESLLIEHHGNKLAFLGCNAVGPEYDWATEETPGSNPCNNEALQKQIHELKGQGYQTIVTFQHMENCAYEPLPPQRGDFYKAAEAGAVIVSGSQAHCPQGMTFKDGAFIHYGLGNLFFDQTDLIQRIGFIDEYVFYNGNLISINLLPIVIEDQAQPRLMIGEEKDNFLKQIFEASGW
jgi:hypothetical protein